MLKVPYYTQFTAQNGTGKDRRNMKYKVQSLRRRFVLVYILLNDPGIKRIPKPE